MAAPKAVQIKAEQAEELRKSIYENTPDEGVQEEPENLNPEEVEESAAPDTDPAPAGEEAGHAEETTDDLKEQHRKLEAAYNTLQGKYKAEVPRLQAQLNEVIARANDLQSKLDAKEQSTQEAPAAVGELAESLREELGDDAAKAVQTFAQQLVQSSVKQATEDLQKTTKEQQEARFWNTVRNTVYDFDSINTSPEFIQWLAQPNPDTGLSRQDDLNRAGADLDSASVISIFQEFKQRNAKATPPPNQATPEQHLDTPRVQRQAPVEQKPQYTPADYQTLQMEIQRGLWRGKEAEAAALEKEILEAITA